MNNNETYFKELKNDLHDLSEEQRLQDIEAQQKEKSLAEKTMNQVIDDFERLEGI